MSFFGRRSKTPPAPVTSNGGWPSLGVFQWPKLDSGPPPACVANAAPPACEMDVPACFAGAACEPPLSCEDECPDAYGMPLCGASREVNAAPCDVECSDAYGMPLCDAPCGVNAAPCDVECSDACRMPPCDAAGLHGTTYQANPMRQYMDEQQDIYGQKFDIATETAEATMQQRRSVLEQSAINPLNTWTNLETMILDATRDPLGYEHSLVAMIMTLGDVTTAGPLPDVEQHFAMTFKDMTLKHPLPHEKDNNRLFRSIKVYDNTRFNKKKYEAADILYYEFTQTTDQFLESTHEVDKVLGWHGLKNPRELQRYGAEWILVRSKYALAPYMRSHYMTYCTQASFNGYNYTICRLYEEPISRELKSGDDAVYTSALPQTNAFEGYETHLDFLRKTFNQADGGNVELAYKYPLDVREFLQNSEWRAEYQDLMCANMHYGQFKLLERSMFMVMFAAYRYQSRNPTETIDSILKRLTCVYLGGGHAGAENQHFRMLLDLIPHFLIVSYDVHKPDVGGTWSTAGALGVHSDDASKHKDRLLVVQKMCDYNEVKNIVNTMIRTDGDRIYVVVQDIRTDISLLLCECEAYRSVAKKLTQALNIELLKSHAEAWSKRMTGSEDTQNPVQKTKNHAYIEDNRELIEKLRTALSKKKQIRAALLDVVQRDNICQAAFAEEFNTAKNCEAVCAKWTFAYPDNRRDNGDTYCPPGLVYHQSFLGQSTEHVAVFTAPKYDVTGRDMRGGACWEHTGDKNLSNQQLGKWNDLRVGTKKEGRFMTNQYELQIPKDVKDMKELCGKIKKTKIDGVISWLQLKDPREEHVGAGMKFQVMHMYQKLCRDLGNETQSVNKQVGILWSNLQHAQTVALAKKTKTLQHAWFYAQHLHDLQTLNVTAEEFENSEKLLDMDIVKFAQNMHIYKTSKKSKSDILDSIKPKNALHKYAEFLSYDSENIWDYSEQGYQVNILLSLEPVKELIHILNDCIDKRVLGQLLLRLSDQYHVLTKEGVERLPEVQAALEKQVTTLSCWPGVFMNGIDQIQLRTKIKKYSELGILSKDVYCNLFLPVIKNPKTRYLMQNVSVDDLRQGLKPYLMKKEEKLVWPLANGQTTNLAEYPSNKSYYELAAEFDIVPMMELIFKQCKNDTETQDLLKKRFNKSGGRYSYAFHTAVYYGSINVVIFLLGKAKEVRDERIIHYVHQQDKQETPLDIAQMQTDRATENNEKSIYRRISQMLVSKGAKSASIESKLPEKRTHSGKGASPVNRFARLRVG